MKPRGARDKAMRRPPAAKGELPRTVTRWVHYVDPETGRGLYRQEPLPCATSLESG